MNKNIRDRYETRARIMKALGHPSRLFIVDELSKQDRCVCELTEMIGADISTVSKHLSILREVGIVDYEKSGTQTNYRLANYAINVDIMQAMHGLDTILTYDLKEYSDHEKSQSKRCPA